jgi:Xaa-Pro dipeptidase
MLLRKEELDDRLESFKDIMEKDNPGWEMAIIISKVNQYYLAGTMQDGMLIITPEGEPVLWVRRSFERAMEESPLTHIKPMGSYRTAAAHYRSIPQNIYLEKEIVPLAMKERLQNYFPCQKFLSLDRQLLNVRAVKSDYELDIIRKAGEKHQILLEKRVPLLLQEGMSEMSFTARLFSEMIDLEYQGVSRFAMFQTEMVLGQIGFGDNSCYPTYFNGPGGNRGSSPAIPVLGDPHRVLTRGDMVFADIGFGYDGYHTDHTMTYLFGGDLTETARIYHDYCVEIEAALAARLKPGEIPTQIYQETMESIEKNAPSGFSDCFMGLPGNQVKFLGHGVGLHVDEYPVIARGFDEPLKENMILALEPKCAVKGVGTVGVEDTYLVTDKGGISLTGSSKGMIRIIGN